MVIYHLMHIPNASTLTKRPNLPYLPSVPTSDQNSAKTRTRFTPPSGMMVKSTCVKGLDPSYHSQTLYRLTSSPNLLQFPGLSLYSRIHCTIVSTYSYPSLPPSFRYKKKEQETHKNHTHSLFFPLVTPSLFLGRAAYSCATSPSYFATNIKGLDQKTHTHNNTSSTHIPVLRALENHSTPFVACSLVPSRPTLDPKVFIP